MAHRSGLVWDTHAEILGRGKERICGFSGVWTVVLQGLQTLVALWFRIFGVVGVAGMEFLGAFSLSCITPCPPQE